MRAAFPWIMAAGVLAILASGTVPAAATEEAYFILVGAGPGVIPKSPVAIDRNGKVIGNPIKVLPPLVEDTIGRTSGQGSDFSIITQTRGKERFRSVSVTPDGQLVCHAVVPVPDDGPLTSRVLVLDSKGKTIRTVNFAAMNVRVFGTPVLLADGRRLGLTVCELPEKRGGRRSDPPASTPAERAEQSARRVASQQQWMAGKFPSQPYVATIDLDGRSLKRIGPGAMPAWSPDGNTILFTEVRIDDPLAPPSTCRLCAMNSDGTNVHPVAGELTCNGTFSPNGKSIAYIGEITSGLPATSTVFVAEADGTNPRSINAEHAVYTAPRWIDDRRIQVASSGVIWAVEPDTKQRKRLSPVELDSHALAHGAITDMDSSAWVGELSHTRRQGPAVAGRGKRGFPLPGPGGLPADPLADERPVGGTAVFRTLPKGSTLQFRGTKVFIRDAKGKMTPPEDGSYKLPNGQVIKVLNGTSIIQSN